MVKHIVFPEFLLMILMYCWFCWGDDVPRGTKNLIMNITIEDVMENPEIKWSYEYLSSNPNITIKDVVEHSEIKWDYHMLSQNPNI